MTVELALYKGKGQIGNAFIRLWTGSIYSHCELVVDGWCYSSSVMDKGVRRKLVGEGEDRISLAPDKWDLMPLPWVDSKSVVEYFEATNHHRYGWPSLILSQFLNLNRPVKGAQFCSEWCAAAAGLPAPTILNPRTLGEWCEYLGGVHDFA
ncbi:hypothetical protein [Stutzerimonas stutzeri]|uniref:hypothetical protein n=1 Tax=Stutzerimonas stutzeri TaxID=316 RepID=UPI0015E2BCAB|nr:hypothetical protein [Stutzerimonas stutzeri]MBA1227853.1 hypothetical protein [Stutzerimonas stutzeri]